MGHWLSVTFLHQTENQSDTRMKAFPLLYFKSVGLRWSRLETHAGSLHQISKTALARRKESQLRSTKQAVTKRHRDQFCHFSGRESRCSWETNPQVPVNTLRKKKKHTHKQTDVGGVKAAVYQSLKRQYCFTPAMRPGLSTDSWDTRAEKKRTKERGKQGVRQCVPA